MTTRKTGAKIEEDYGSLLVDIEPVYLTDKRQWLDFKKAANEAAMAWNIPDWNATVLKR